jgi:parvulin-like peptidyl-prolyl isomerase
VLADKQSAAAGVDFDELAEEQFRLILSKIYVQRKFYPQIEISADDERRFYQQNIAQYTTPASAQFRVIKIDYQKSGGRQRASDKIQDILKRARAGEDFASLAARFNDDPTLMKNNGAVGENGQMPRGAYVIDPVENAVWKLRPGDITDAIDTGDAFYIARVEALNGGGSRPFSDPEVQSAIYSRLERQQLQKLREKELVQLRKDSIIVPNDGMDQVVMEMIVQKYPQWAKK